MIKISDLPNINTSLSAASLLPLVQDNITSNTSFANISANIFKTGIQTFNYVPKLVSQNDVDPIYSDSFNFQSQYAVFNNKIVVFNGVIYASSVTSNGTGIAAITLPDVGVYVPNSVAVSTSWYQLFNLNALNSAGYQYTLGFSQGPSSSNKPEYHNKIVKLRYINNTSSGGSPDLPFSTISTPSVNVQSGMGLAYFGIGFLN